MNTVKTFLKRFIHLYPVTLIGTILFILLVYLLGRSYVYKNPYGLFISLIGLVIIVLCSVLSRVQARRLEAQQVSWESHDPLYAGRKGSKQKLSVPSGSTFLFFRIHFAVFGWLHVGRKASLFFFTENSFPGKGTVEIPLLLPLCGTYEAHARVTIKDVFGLTRAICSYSQKRSLPVQPVLLSGEDSVQVQATGGTDTKQKRKTSDEEKYYMREYVPGDRFRDINWKATSRLNDIVTRISPVTQEKTRLIFVDFRHFAKMRDDTLESVYHLHYIKCKLISFLWSIKRENPDYQFHIASGLGTVLLENEEDIKRFSTELTGIMFQKDPGVIREPIGVDRLFIFSTAFDDGIGAYVRMFAGIPTTIFRTVAVKGKQNRRGDDIRFFSLPSQPYVPSLWLCKRTPEKRGPGVGSRGDNTVVKDEKLTITLI